MEFYSNEQIARAKNIDIIAFAESKGMTLERSGREYRIKGYGGLTVNPSTNDFYIHSQQKGGHGAIAFCEKVLNMSFKEAMQELVGSGEKTVFQNYTSPKDNEKRKELIMPERNKDFKRIYAYLILQRRINKEIINDFVHKGLLYQDKNGNAVFVHKDDTGKAIGANIAGTLSAKRYKGVAAGTKGAFEYSKGEEVKTVYLFEAPIDLMSYVQLHPEINDAKFVAMSGLKPNLIQKYIDDNNLKIISCVDNDAAGINFNNRILSDKMKESLGSDMLESHSINNGEISIEYCSLNNNGKEMTFFLSKEDYYTAQNLGGKISGSVLSWINRSNFTVNRECAEAGVKDFNDLLKNQASTFEKATTEDKNGFANECQNAEQWANAVNERVQEIEKELEPKHYDCER